MAFVDEVSILVRAGKGGDGSVAFRREKFIPKGGPYGGDGGDGGDVYICVVEDTEILRHYKNQQTWSAQNGENGGSARKEGKGGKDLVLLIPVGTIVTDQATGKQYDLATIGQKLCIAKGGKGGRGNVHFATAVNRTPLTAEKGTAGETKKFTFELRLIADVGFMGLPNAGKSSLLNELTNSHVKVGPYPFTTLEPNLGVMDGLILADIPGLIEGASHGKGLGSIFLRHIARTSVLAHCISSESEDPLADYHTVREELQKYNPYLGEKSEIIVLTKSDLLKESELKKQMLTLKKTGKTIIPVSIHDLDKLMVLRRILLASKN